MLYLYNGIIVKHNNTCYFILNILYSVIILSIFILYYIFNYNLLSNEIKLFNLHFIIQFLLINYIYIYTNLPYKSKYFLIIPLLITLIIIIYHICYNEFNILNILNYLFGFNILLFNIINFIIIFSNKLYLIYNNFYSLEKLISNNISRGLIDSIYNIIKIKYDISCCISNYYLIFNYFTLINIITNIIIFKSKNFNYINISIIVFSFIFEIICLTIILVISKIRQNILTLIYSPTFTNRFLKKINLDTLNDITTEDISIDIENNIVEIDNNQLSIHLIRENNNSLEWIVIHNILNNYWMDFSLFGFKLHNIDAITKIILIISFIYTIT